MGRWLIFSLITLILWGLWGVVLKIATNKILEWKSVYIATNSAIIVVLTVILLTSIGNLKLTPTSYLWGFFAGLMGTLGYIFLVLSLEAGGKASVVIALTSVYPVLTALLSKYILKEKITNFQWAGIFLAVIAIILLSIESK